MPIYEYACKACGHEFEREQRISDAPIKKCPSCGALKARRQISRTSFVLKGGGWYSDLYGAAKPAKGEDAAAPAQDAKPAADAGATKAPAESTSDASGKGDAAAAPKGDTKAPKDDGKPPKSGGKGPKAAAA